MKVLVVGAGFAGVAAAFAARRAGASVTLVERGAGASSLYAGVVDGRLTEEAPLLELARALGLRLSSHTVVATREGIVRTAAGADGALLDLGPLAGKRIGLVDVVRDDWDGPLLARSFSASPWARATGTAFELVPLELLEKSHQRRVSSYDFATSFERAERPAWLAELLKAHAGPDAWLFGPWLGVRRELARELSLQLGVPVGEVTSPPGGVAGARFELRSLALLRSLDVQLVTAAVARVRTKPDEITLELADGAELAGAALVFAGGGFVSGSDRAPRRPVGLGAGRLRARGRRSALAAAAGRAGRQRFVALSAWIYRRTAKSCWSAWVCRSASGWGALGEQARRRCSRPET